MKDTCITNTNSTPGVPTSTAQPHSSCRQKVSCHKKHRQEDFWISQVHNLISNLVSNQNVILQFLSTITRIPPFFSTFKIKKRFTFLSSFTNFEEVTAETNHLTRSSPVSAPSSLSDTLTLNSFPLKQATCF